MSTAISEISAAQKASWNKFSPGWRKWDANTMAFLAPHGAAIIEHLKPPGSAVVLDIAAGTGEPGLSLARMLTHGRVVLTDLSAGMLDAARVNANARGLQNVEVRECGVDNLPFADASVDWAGDELPAATVTLSNPDGDAVEITSDDGIDYDAGGSQGSSIGTVTIEQAGDPEHVLVGHP